MSLVQGRVLRSNDPILLRANAGHVSLTRPKVMSAIEACPNQVARRAFLLAQATFAEMGRKIIRRQVNEGLTAIRKYRETGSAWLPDDRGAGLLRGRKV